MHTFSSRSMFHLETWYWAGNAGKLCVDRDGDTGRIGQPILSRMDCEMAFGFIKPVYPNAVNKIAQEQLDQGMQGIRRHPAGCFMIRGHIVKDGIVIGKKWGIVHYHSEGIRRATGNMNYRQICKNV